jgi:hypothetical protein
MLIIFLKIIKKYTSNINKYLATFLIIYIIGNFALSDIPIFHNHKLNKNITYNVDYSNHNNYKLSTAINNDECVRCQWLVLFNNIIDNSFHLKITNYFTFFGYNTQYIHNTFQTNFLSLNARSPPLLFIKY